MARIWDITADLYRAQRNGTPPPADAPATGGVLTGNPAPRRRAGALASSLALLTAGDDPRRLG